MVYFWPGLRPRLAFLFLSCLLVLLFPYADTTDMIRSSPDFGGRSCKAGRENLYPSTLHDCSLTKVAERALVN
ncbi:hypothetical protein BO99DRAFT_407495 [Aspergillus violaceofuscus CBS 115571]|uniref:Secreted protein n=1 Tax=Aspergillus violaceofuscus (strain CBS 115571) TaxID=1450538 RepID=A0A2V5HNE3_ASPV1|nr:hypothetical protein BO99DRAFT_407495 [Aspergillus violaceofuscus CBS 115571]